MWQVQTQKAPLRNIFNRTHCKMTWKLSNFSSCLIQLFNPSDLDVKHVIEQKGGRTSSYAGRVGWFRKDWADQMDLRRPYQRGSVYETWHGTCHGHSQKGRVLWQRRKLECSLGWPCFQHWAIPDAGGVMRWHGEAVMHRIVIQSQARTEPATALGLM